MPSAKHNLKKGSIMAISISPNGRFLVSAASDHTAKLWSIVSYMKEIENVQNELRVRKNLRLSYQSVINISVISRKQANIHENLIVL